MGGVHVQADVSPSERQEFKRVLARHGYDHRDFIIDDRSIRVGFTGNIAVIVTNRRNRKEGIYNAGPGASWVPEFETALEAGAFA